MGSPLQVYPLYWKAFLAELFVNSLILNINNDNAAGVMPGIRAASAIVAGL